MAVSPPQCPTRGRRELLSDSSERPQFAGTQKHLHQKWRRITQNRHASRQAADTKRFVDEMCCRSRSESPRIGVGKVSVVNSDEE
jgi:hypothetical protein